MVHLLFVFSRLKSILYLSPRGTRLQNVGCRTDLVVEQALASVKEEFGCRISYLFFISGDYFLKFKGGTKGGCLLKTIIAFISDLTI